MLTWDPFIEYRADLLLSDFPQYIAIVSYIPGLENSFTNTL